MSSRRDYKGANRKGSGASGRGEKSSGSGGGGSLVTGLFIGLLIGLVAAAAMAWYFYSKPSEFKPSEQVSAAQPEKPVKPAAVPKPVEASPVSPAPTPSAPSAPPAALPPPPIEPIPEAKPAKPEYSFYDILPGSTPPKPKPPPKIKEVWWLQLFALKSAKDADRYKARLALLNLPVVVQAIDSGGITLYRVRVGPYPTEDAALGALDTLSVNNFEPRLLKEPVPN
jgi:cell division protein FtsN